MDEKEIRQLLLNLAWNGFEAMDTGGKLTIGTYAEHDKVVLFVQDTGTGISSAVLDKLGTPFVTTKDTGTGLGLPVCYRIVEHHRAKIDIETSLEGTTLESSSEQRNCLHKRMPKYSKLFPLFLVRLQRRSVDLAVRGMGALNPGL